MSMKKKEPVNGSDENEQEVEVSEVEENEQNQEEIIGVGWVDEAIRKTEERIDQWGEKLTAEIQKNQLPDISQLPQMIANEVQKVLPTKQPEVKEQKQPEVKQPLLKGEDDHPEVKTKNPLRSLVYRRK